MTLTEAHVRLYGSLGGDEVAPGLVPDLVPLCVATGLAWRVPRPTLVVLAFMGLEWEMVHILRVGDTVYGRSRTAAKRSLREGGVVVEEHELVDQEGRVVQRGRLMFLIAKRPGLAAGSRKETRHAV